MIKNTEVSTNKDDCLAALKAAITAIYFRYPSDYEALFYDVIIHLGGDKARMMIDMDNIGGLYEEYCGDNEND